MATARYTEAEKKAALVELARVSGRVGEAEKITGVTRQSLRQWRKDYHEFYLRAAADNADEIEERTIAELRERLDAANDLEAAILRKLEDAVNNETLKAGELAAILQRVAVVKGINADKILKLSGRSLALPPGNVNDLLKSLGARGIIVDAEVVEEKEKPALTAGLSPNGEVDGPNTLRREGSSSDSDPIP